MPLPITIPAQEAWDEAKEEFVQIKETKLLLEHSLLSVSKWEEKWHKPFLSKDKKTPEELLDYIRCMTISSNIDPEVYKYLTPQNIREVNAYIEDPATATWFSDTDKKQNREIVTSEIIYYWITTFRINWKVEKWHLNRLLALIRVMSIKNTPEKERSVAEINKEYHDLNEMRKKRFHSTG